MAIEERKYPGELASPRQLLALADEYRKAATMLLELGRPGKPHTQAPFRLSAIQAIELYLTALLLHLGHSPGHIRTMGHDLSVRMEHALEAGLLLRAKTAKHLQTLSQNREYLITRYGPELATKASHITRLTATLDEVAAKVAILIAKPPRQRVEPIAAG